MKPLVLLSFSLTFLTQVFANEFSAPEPSKQLKEERNDYLAAASKSKQSKNSSQGEWCLSPYHEMHASIRHNEANGIGYKDGYSTLEAFGIYDGWGSSFMPFVDLRGHIFNNGYLAGNLGIGERTLFTSINHTFGSYLYYDVRRVGHGLTVNQLSPGIELVGERMEYRINGYFPLGKQKGKQYGFEFDKFTGNSIILKSKQNQAMRGFDAEVGVHIPQNTTYDVYAAAGPYYFHSSNASAWGGRARLLGRYKEYVTLEVAYSYDKLFRNVVQGSIAFTVPFGGKLQRCGRCCPQTDNLLLSRAAFAPSRFEIPVVKKVHKKDKAIDPATGKPWVVWFVNNTSHSAGTFESPFPTLLQAQNASSPNDMIYVFPGDGTTAGMNTGITLKDRQTFFGSGIKQQLSTTKGTKTIPAMSSNNPSITTGAGTVVALGNSNTVSGFNVFVRSNGSAIASPSNITNATIINNNVTGTAAVVDAIQVLGLGTVNISNNQVTGAGVVGTAIQVKPTGGMMSGVISNNSILGFDNGIGLNTVNNGNFDLTFEGNAITNFAADGIFAFMNGQSTMNIIGNSINNNVGANGIHVESQLITVSNVFIDSNNLVVTEPGADNGIFISIGSALSLTNTHISNNLVQSSVGAGFTSIKLMANNTATICSSLYNNTAVTIPGEIAFGFSTTGSGVLNIDSFPGSNIGGPMSITGNVYNVAPGTCGND